MFLLCSTYAQLLSFPLPFCPFFFQIIFLLLFSFGSFEMFFRPSSFYSMILRSAFTLVFWGYLSLALTCSLILVGLWYHYLIGATVFFFLFVISSSKIFAIIWHSSLHCNCFLLNLAHFDSFSDFIKTLTKCGCCALFLLIFSTFSLPFFFLILFSFQ